MNPPSSIFRITPKATLQIKGWRFRLSLAWAALSGGKSLSGTLDLLITKDELVEMNTKIIHAVHKAKEKANAGLVIVR